MHNKKGYQILVYKTIITTLEKKKILKTKISFDNQITSKFSAIIPTIILTIIQREIGDFEDIFNTSDSQSVCNADKSGD